MQHGLCTKFVSRDAVLYGNGLYFADASCKASQYADPTPETVILICRVIVVDIATAVGRSAIRLVAFTILTAGRHLDVVARVPTP